MIRAMLSELLRARRALPLLTSLLLATACGDETGSRSDGWAGSVDTLPGGAVLVSSPARGVWDDGEAWRLEADLRIGSAEGDGPELFGRIASVQPDSLGRVWVLDSQAGEVRLFDGEGSWVRTVGRAGQGPGELGSPMSLFVLGDELWVVDNGQRRYTVFDTAGAHRTSYRFPGFTYAASAQVGADGVWDMEPRQSGDPRLGRWVPEGGDLVLADSFPAGPVPEFDVVEVTRGDANEGMRMMMPIPFVHQPSRWIRAGGGWIATPGGGEYRFVWLGPALDTLRIVERVWDPVPLPADERQAALARFPAESRSTVEERLPAHHPPFARILEGDDGTLWVFRVAGPDGRWGIDVFDSSGRYLGEADASLDPARMTLHRATADALYGVWRDAMDVPHAVRLRIERPGSP